jgi:uncharacterized protein YuzE
MRLDFDLNVGALYISLSDHDVARTRVVDDNTMVDLDAGGVAVGIEVIATAYPWPVEDVLRDFRMPPGQVEQVRSYFRPSIPGTTEAAPVTRYEAPAILVAA